MERSFLRVSSGAGLVAALNDIEYLVVYPDATRWTALKLSAGILREALSFFLGQVDRQDLRIMAVTGFSNGELSVEVVDPARLDPEPVGGGGGGGGGGLRGCGVPPSAPLPGGRGASTRWVGGELEVQTSHSLQPTWNVRNKAVTSFLVDTRTAHASTTELPPLMAAQVGRSSVAFAAQKVQACRLAGSPVALHVPVPLGALTLQAGRYPLLSMLSDLPFDVRRLIVIELTGVPEGVPQGRLSEAVAMLAPHARAVLARAPSDSASLLAWRRCGLNGVTLDCRHIASDDRLALKRLSNFARDALAIAPACVGYSLEAMSLLVAAWGAGFTHLSGAAVCEEVRELAAVRLAPSELYSRALGCS